MDEVCLEEVGHRGVSYSGPFLSPEASHTAMPKAKRNNQTKARSRWSLQRHGELTATLRREPACSLHEDRYFGLLFGD